MIILPNGVSKLTGLLYTLDKWQFSLKETVTIGSGIDDIEIIEASDSVGNGKCPPKVKNAADWVTRSVEQHGVHYVVKSTSANNNPCHFLKK